MKIELNLAWFLHKLRLVFLLAVFYGLYVYAAPVFGFTWIIYFLLNDLSEIINDIDVLKENEKERIQNFKSMSHKRKGF